MRSTSHLSCHEFTGPSQLLQVVNCLLLVSTFYIVGAGVTLTGGRLNADSEEVAYTCIVTESSSLTWSVKVSGMEQVRVIFNSANLNVTVVRDEFNVTLRSVNPINGQFYDFTSVLTFNATDDRDNSVITCSDGVDNATVTFILNPSDCGPPASPRDGTVNYTTTTEGSQATFQCSAQQMMSVCTNGSWIPDPGDLVCTQGDCGVPATPTNGTVNYTTTTEGSRATFQCSAGLVPGEVMTAVCENSGGVDHWNPDPGNSTCSMPMPKSSDFPLWVIAIIIVGLIAIGVIIGIFIWRHYKRQSGIDYPMWLIVVIIILCFVLVGIGIVLCLLICKCCYTGEGCKQGGVACSKQEEAAMEL